jgi:hypothetical protein
MESLAVIPPLFTRGAARWVGVLVTGSALGCSGCRNEPAREAPRAAQTAAEPAPPEPAARELGAHEQKRSETPAALRSCSSVGPMGCAAAPSKRADLCTQSRPCVLLDTPDPSFLEDMTLDCGDPPFAESVKNEAPASPPEAPDVSLVNLVGMTGMMVRAAASYLVVERAEGACLVDTVHGWDMSPSASETTFEARWEQTPAGLRLHVQSQRTLHEPLDDGEFAEGVSDVRSESCERLVYALDAGKFTLSSRNTNPGACDAGLP